MAIIRIQHIAPYDGEHPIDLSWFDMGELARIYDITGLRPIYLNEALLEQDAKLVVALSVVALERQGHEVEWLEPFWKAKSTDIYLDTSKGPGVPDPVPPVGSPPSPENDDGEPEKRPSSGERSPDDGDSSPESDRSGTGDPGSATS